MTRIEEIEARALKATEGPWIGGHFSDDEHPCECTTICCQNYAGMICNIGIANNLPIGEGGNDCPPLDEAKANSDFIAHAREDIPYLLAENKMMREALAEAIDGIEEWAAYAGEYFKEKHDLAGQVAKFRAALKGIEP